MPMSQQKMGKVEFIALMAMLVATVAFSIDGMLPALPEMAKELTPDDPNRVQLVIAAFIVGMAFGTLVAGPLSDRFGRKPVILAGAILYVIAAAACLVTRSLEPLLVARFFQGIGAAAPRVVSQALTRDLFAGREMAKISSFVMMIFTLVPAIAPLIGSVVINSYGWRGVFAGFIIFVIFATFWMQVRIVEPVNDENRRPFRFRPFKDALNDMLALPMVRLSIIVQVFAYTVLFLSIMLVQPVFDLYFNSNATFPIWFAAIAILAGSASLLNAVLVMKFGMRTLIVIALTCQFFLALIMILTFGFSGLGRHVEFYLYAFWLTSLFFAAGMTLGNLTALALEPLGYIAGTATSIMGATSAFASALLAGTIGQFFDGTPMAHVYAVCVMTALALYFARKMKLHDRVKQT